MVAADLKEGSTNKTSPEVQHPKSVIAAFSDEQNCRILSPVFFVLIGITLKFETDHV